MDARSYVKSWCDRNEKNLFESVEPFWRKYSEDGDKGYVSCLDYDGSTYSEKKYLWLIGRQVYMYSHLFTELKGKAEETQRLIWLMNARKGVDFLDNFLNEDKMLFFSCSRDGSKLLKYQRKPYGPVFYVQGKLAFWRACRTYTSEKETGNFKNFDELGFTSQMIKKYFEQALDMYQVLIAYLDNFSLCEGTPKSSPKSDLKETSTSILGAVMCKASLALDFLDCVNEKSLPIHWSIEDLLNFRKERITEIMAAMVNCKAHFDTRVNRNVFLENAHKVNGCSSDTPEGRLFVPGHSIEVAWFLLKMCDTVRTYSSQPFVLTDEALAQANACEELALKVIEGTLKQGWDSKFGGLFYMMDIEGKPLVDCTCTADGKLWWPHTEAMIALIMAFVRDKDVNRKEKWIEWLKKVDDYTYNHFAERPDDKLGVGGWYGYCNRDGSLSSTCKGGSYKGFFHVPRALLMCIQIGRKWIDEEGKKK
eukprot:g3871.t1